MKDSLKNNCSLSKGKLFAHLELDPNKICAASAPTVVEP